MKIPVLFLFVLVGNISLCQTHQYFGTWTKINTTYQFDFDLTLEVKDANQVEGYFNWKLVHYDENNMLSKKYYEKKIDMTAIEYVKGTYDESKGEYVLKGYEKRDPNAIIGTDTYHLKISNNGNIEGTTNANGSWLGRIKGQQNKLDLM